MPSCEACAVEESQGRRAAADVCRPVRAFGDMVATPDQRHDAAWPSDGPPRFPSVRNPYLRAALSRLYLDFRLSLLCGMVCTQWGWSPVWSRWSKVNSTQWWGRSRCFPSSDSDCAVLVIRWDVGGHPRGPGGRRCVPPLTSWTWNRTIIRTCRASGSAVQRWRAVRWTRISVEDRTTRRRASPPARSRAAFQAAGSGRVEVTTPARREEAERRTCVLEAMSEG